MVCRRGSLFVEVLFRMRSYLCALGMEALGLGNRVRRVGGGGRSNAVEAVLPPMSPLRKQCWAHVTQNNHATGSMSALVVRVD